jgi:threonine/homoserine/homoserine lactone efflux protein
MHQAPEGLAPNLMRLDPLLLKNLITFLVAATALLGSPGPGIASLIGAGRKQGALRSIPYWGMMQVGLALAAVASATGIAAMLLIVPGLHIMLLAISAAYLLWLAWSIAAAPLTGNLQSGYEPGSFSLAGAFTLGAANPKAYLAFASLFGSFTILGRARLQRHDSEDCGLACWSWPSSTSVGCSLALGWAE